VACSPGWSIVPSLDVAVCVVRRLKESAERVSHLTGRSSGPDGSSGLRRGHVRPSCGKGFLRCGRPGPYGPPVGTPDSGSSCMQQLAAWTSASTPADRGDPPQCPPRREPARQQSMAPVALSCFADDAPPVAPAGAAETMPLGRAGARGSRYTALTERPPAGTGEGRCGSQLALGRPAATGSGRARKRIRDRSGRQDDQANAQHAPARPSCSP
jgi:hypothetical protein